jgi:polyisoprenoid-binding protein YceI
LKEADMWKRLIALSFFTCMVLVGALGYAALKAPPAASGPIQVVALQVSGGGAANASGAGSKLFEIQPSASTASFRLTEVLRGEPTTVVGTTDQVSGQVAVDFDEPAAAEVGTILINARTLATDNAQRNSAIANFILGTGQYEYISFAPTIVTGEPATAEVGSSYGLQLTGALTIKGVSRDVTFNASVTPVSATKLDGTASATVRFADWGLAIPDVPFVADVSDEVMLGLSFVAIAV